MYSKATVKLQLPGELTIFDIDWLSIYNIETKENFGSVIIPDSPNVPPSLVKIIVSFIIKFINLLLLVNSSIVIYASGS